MLVKIFQLAGGARKSLLVAMSLIIWVSAIGAPEAEAQLFRRLRARFAPPFSPQPPFSRLPQYRQQQTPNPSADQRQRGGNQQPTPLNRLNSADADDSRNPRSLAPTNSDAYGGSILQLEGNGDTRSSQPTLGIQGRNHTLRTPAVEVLEFRDHSKADEAGLQVGDLIMAVDGRATPTTEALSSALAARQPGEIVRLRVQRNQRTGDIDVPLVRVPDAPRQRVARPAISPAKAEGGKMGVHVRSAEGSRGAVVVSIEPNSPAERAGIETGDRIVSVNGRMISDTPTLIRELAVHAPGDSVAVQLVRDDQLYAPRVTLNDGTNSAVKKDSAEDLPDDAKQSVLEGVGSVIGGLFSGSQTTEQELPPPPVITPGKRAMAASTKTDAKAAGKREKKKDVLAFGDDEPIDEVFADAFRDGSENIKSSGLDDDPPSLKGLQPTSKAERVAELEAAIKRLQEQVQELKAGS